MHIVFFSKRSQSMHSAHCYLHYSRTIFSSFDHTVIFSTMRTICFSLLSSVDSNHQFTLQSIHFFNVIRVCSAKRKQRKTRYTYTGSELPGASPCKVAPLCAHPLAYKYQEKYIVNNWPQQQQHSWVWIIIVLTCCFRERSSFLPHTLYTTGPQYK